MRAEDNSELSSATVDFKEILQEAAFRGGAFSLDQDGQMNFTGLKFRSTFGGTDGRLAFLGKDCIADGTFI